MLENTCLKDAENEVEQVTHTSPISNVGICGRKSLPTKNKKKHSKTKSSSSRSKLITNGGLGISSSYCKFSSKTHMFRNYKWKIIS